LVQFYTVVQFSVSDYFLVEDWYVSETELLPNFQVLCHEWWVRVDRGRQESEHSFPSSPPIEILPLSHTVQMIVLSKSSLLGWFLHVSLIVIIKGRSPMKVSLIVIINQV
jgi:hypothetical protein